MPNKYTIAGLNIKPYSRQLFENSLNEAFHAIPNKKCDWSKDRDSILDIVNTYSNPGEKFSFLGNGCFKEVYQLNICDNYIVKFYSQGNDTASERALLEAAASEGLSFAFIPTYFVDFFGLTCDMPILLEDFDECNIYDDFDSYSGDCEYPYATGLEIQPKIAMTVADSIDPEFWDVYEAYGTDPDRDPPDPAIDPNTKEPIPYEIIRRLCISNRTWVEEFARFYGIKALKRLADFSEKYQLHDLHTGNIGYLKDVEGHFRPIIIDWLSLDAKKIKQRCSAN